MEKISSKHISKLARQARRSPINLHLLFSIILSFVLTYFIHYKRPEIGPIDFLLRFSVILSGLIILDIFAAQINARFVTTVGTGVSGSGYILYKLGMTKFDGFLLGIGSSIIASIWFYHLIEKRIGNLTILDNEDGSVRLFLQLVASQKNGMKKFRIMDTWTELTTEAFQKQFENALSSKRDLFMEILLANPFSNIIRQREDDLDSEIQQIAQAGISKLFNLCANNPDINLQVRLYSTTISCRFYSSEVKTLFSFYPPGMKADEVPCLEFFSSSPLGKYVRQHFLTVWESRKTIGLNQHMRVCLVPPKIYNIKRHEDWTKEYMFCVTTNRNLFGEAKSLDNDYILLVFVSEGAIRQALIEGLDGEPINVLIDPAILEWHGENPSFDHRNPQENDNRDSIVRIFNILDERRPTYSDEKEKIWKMFGDKYGHSNVDVIRLRSETTIFLTSVVSEKSQ
jgi:hypothetical protein